MKKTTHILICDDQPILHETLGAYLSAEGYTHASAYDGAEALRLAFDDKPDLMLLDIMMPVMSGIDVCREVRKTSRVPIIMLTARGEEFDRVLGLEIGADDYIVKPFSQREVVARIKAVLRRMELPGEAAEEGDDDALRFDRLEIDLARYEVRVDGEIAAFTPKEVEVLHLLASHPGVVMGREAILSQVWGYDFYGDTRAVDTQIKRIRAKLPSEGVSWNIRSIYGVGYKFEVRG